MSRAIVIMLVLVSLVLGWKASSFLSVDRCLDAGGVWDDRGGVCVGVPMERLQQ